MLTGVGLAWPECETLLFQRCWIVSDLFSGAKPADITVFRSFFRIQERLHTVIEKGVWLHKVDNVECVLSVRTRIRNLEVKPLSVV